MESFETEYASACKKAKEYCNNHFKYDLGIDDVSKARKESSEVNAKWCEMFDKYVETNTA